MTPSFSVAMTTYNAAPYLAEQLESLARQTLTPAELQIGDDGSIDETESIVTSFARTAPFPVTYVCNETQLYFGENFIRTAQRCSSEWIAFCDHDDVWDSRKFEWAAAAIARGPTDLKLLVHNAVVTDERLNRGGLLYDYSAGETVTGRLQLPPEWYSLGFTQIFRASLIRNIPSARRVSFPWHKHRNAHDVWIALLANCTGSVLRTNQSLAQYRRHAGAVSGQAMERPPFAREGSAYAQRASYLRDVATTLRQCAESVDRGIALLLSDAAARIADFAQLLDERALAYSDTKLAGRLSHIGRLIGQGAYIGGSGWPFGATRLVKDLLCAMRLL